MARHAGQLARYERKIARLRFERSRDVPHAQSDLATGAPFQRGDVFLTGSGSVQEYSPSGVLQQTVPGTLGSAGLCFDPSGRHLIVPGVGLFDRDGDPLPSNWPAVTLIFPNCVADGFGHVYTGMVGPSGSFSVNQYDLAGDLIQTFALPPVDGESGGALLSIDLAPDECTMYYDSANGALPQIGRFNVCTNTQQAPFGADVGGSVFDELRVLPNWEVAVTFDQAGILFDTLGQPIVGYSPPPPSQQSLRTMGLDPDGTSVWFCCGGDGIDRFDISTGSLISQWSAPGFSPITVYGPPLFGNANVEANVDANPAGTAEAFLTRVSDSGQLTRVHVYVDSSSTASQMVVGIYSNRHGRPGQLLERGTITNVRPGSWNYVDVPSMPVTAGESYWTAVLGPRGSGTAAFRDQRFGGLAFVSSRHNLTDLPSHWPGRRPTLSGQLSAYGS